MGGAREGGRESGREGERERGRVEREREREERGEREREREEAGRDEGVFPRARGDSPSRSPRPARPAGWGSPSIASWDFYSFLGRL